MPDQTPEQVIADAIHEASHYPCQDRSKCIILGGAHIKAQQVVERLRSAGYLLDPGKVAVDREALESAKRVLRYVNPGHVICDHPDMERCPSCDAHAALAALRVVDSNPISPEQLARLFHDRYERYAPQYGYKTRKESAVPWEQVPMRNRELMIETCRAVLCELHLRASEGQP